MPPRRLRRPSHDKEVCVRVRLAAYCRVSTDKTDQLNSLEAQKKFFTEFTRSSGHELVGLYADEGISGTKIRNRKAFLQLMEDARKGLFEMVAVKDISRFARNTVDFLQSIRTLKALGVETTFLTANMTVLGNSEFVLTIFGALAQEESANTSKRVKFGKKINAEKGRVPNLVYGYDKIPGDYFNLQINGEEAAVVRQIFDLYTEGGYGASRIAALLNEAGRSTKRGCKWSQNAVRRILTNPLYTGLVVNGREEVTDFLTGARSKKQADAWMTAERPALRIIPQEQFERAGRLLAERGRAFKADGKRQSNRYLLSTLLRCRCCGWSFRRLTRTYAHTYVRWVCSGRNGHGAESCPNRSALDEPALLAALQTYFLQAAEGDGSRPVREIRELIRSRKQGEEDLQVLSRRLEKLERGRKKYLSLYADDLMSRGELEEALAGLESDREELEGALRLARLDAARQRELETALLADWGNPAAFIRLDHLQNGQLKKLVERIEVDEEGNVDVYIQKAAAS